MTIRSQPTVACDLQKVVPNVTLIDPTYVPDFLFESLIMNHIQGFILLCFLVHVSYAAQCDNVNNMEEVTSTCTSPNYLDNCIVVVMYSNYADCEAFCDAAGSSCLDGWDSHGGSCGNIDQTDDNWPQGCGGDNLGHDGICMCAAGKGNGSCK